MSLSSLRCASHPRTAAEGRANRRSIPGQAGARSKLLLTFSRSSAGWLPRTSSLHDREEVFRAPRATAAALKVGPLFDRKRHMMNVTVNV